MLLYEEMNVHRMYLLKYHAWTSQYSPTRDAVTDKYRAMSGVG